MTAPRLPRRRLLHLAVAGAGPIGLAGCGFHPLYMASAGRTDSRVARELAAIHVTTLGERINQLLKLALEEHFERFGIDAPKRYELVAPMGLSAEGVAIDPTSNITRIRYLASTTWTLGLKDKAHTTVTTGNARVLDGVNIIGSQFFASDEETDVVYRQFATTLADQVVLQIAGYFDQQAAAKTT